MWSDDNLSNKLLYPRNSFNFRAKSWGGRSRTSERSMELCVQRIQRQHDKTPEWMRKKLDSPTVASLSQRATFILAVADEVLAVAPVSKEKVESQWTSAWAYGSEQIDMEVQAALLDQAEVRWNTDNWTNQALMRGCGIAIVSPTLKEEVIQWQTCQALLFHVDELLTVAHPRASARR